MLGILPRAIRMKFFPGARMLVSSGLANSSGSFSGLDIYYSGTCAAARAVSLISSSSDPHLACSASQGRPDFGERDVNDAPFRSADRRFTRVHPKRTRFDPPRKTLEPFFITPRLASPRLFYLASNTPRDLLSVSITVKASFSHISGSPPSQRY